MAVFSNLNIHEVGVEYKHGTSTGVGTGGKGCNLLRYPRFTNCCMRVALLLGKEDAVSTPSTWAFVRCSAWFLGLLPKVWAALCYYDTAGNALLRLLTCAHILCYHARASKTLRKSDSPPAKTEAVRDVLCATKVLKLMKQHSRK